MRHEWILEVLGDLLTYSRRNGLQGLAEQVEGAIEIARIEIGADDLALPPDDPPVGGGSGGMRRQ